MGDKVVNLELKDNRLFYGKDYLDLQENNKP